MNRLERQNFDTIRPVLASGAVFVFIFTFQFYSCPPLLIGIWVLAFGVAAGFLVFSYCPVLPSLFLHWGRRRKNYEEDEQKESYLSRQCSICGNSKCQRHRPEISRAKLKPWEDLLIPESVDAALQEFLGLLLQNHIYSWYRELSSSEICVDEIRTSLRYMAAVLLKRIRKIDIPTLVIEHIGKEGLKHLEMYLRLKEKVIASHATNTQTAILERFGPRMHCAMQSRQMELHYLRKLSECIFPFILPPNSLQCRSLLSLLRELLASAVFLTAVDKLSDPDFVNNLLLLLLDKEPINSALRLSIADILHTQSALFPFMQFMKSEGALNILQFCLTVEDFNKRIFASEETKEEKEFLIKEVKEIFSSYFDTSAVDRINFDPEIVEGLQTCISGPIDKLERLKMATLLSKACEYAYNLLETTFLPLFYQSDDYFSLLCGSRLPAKPLNKPASRVSKKKFDPLAEFSRLAGKLKDKVMNPSKDDSPYEEDPFDVPDTPPDFDLESDYEEDEEAEEEEESRDLSMWKITIPHVIMETKQKCMFIISVERADMTEAARWDVARRYKEFFVLQSKLKEFHGTIDDALLPPKRNSSKSISQKNTAIYFEACRVQFEKYLQYLCSNPLLKGSALLFNFLSPDKEFSNMFGPDKMGDKAGKKFKSMTTILKKEKGQNIDTFLQAFLSSTVEPTKRKPLPKGLLDQSKRIEEGLFPGRRKTSSSSMRLKAEVSGKPLLQVTGVTDYILFLVHRLFNVPVWLYSLLVCGKVAFQQTLDVYADRYLAGKVDLLTNEHRLVMIIHLLRDAIFFDQDPPRTDTQKVERRERTLKEMLHFIPDMAVRVIGKERHKSGMALLFELLQQPRLNKQLTYVLLDCVMGEIFPELKESELFPADELPSH
ncbi:Sorting nexin-14 [Desmophyllum pertusum]|uniref:Sorting nexin-14 n=1 Tax=Desmophyllum pertusum TaxID=174260 RepID=A0A9X0D5B5_9CNID|nr:Sorting nexin-14 [Desmophyllum pertusum]